MSTGATFIAIVRDASEAANALPDLIRGSLMIHVLLVAAMLASPVPVLASAAGPSGESAKGRDGQAMKERVIRYIDAKIRVLESAKSCVRAARDDKDMLACHVQERRQMKELRDKDGGQP